MATRKFTFASLLVLATQASICMPQAYAETPNPATPATPYVPSDYVQKGKVSTYTLPEIAGLWQLELTKIDPKQPTCQELYRFDKDEKMVGVSGKELTYGKYQYRVDTGLLPLLTLRTVYDNNETDCSGKKIDQAGEELNAFVKITGNTMQWCGDVKGEKCTMTLYRILP